MIYLDNAAATFPKPEEIKEFQNAVSGIGECAMEQAVFYLAELFHAESPEQICITGSAGRALSQILRGLIRKKGDVIYVSPFEPEVTARNAAVLQYREGILLQKLPLQADSYNLDVAKIKKQFSVLPPRAVILSHVGNITGIIAPAEEILTDAKKYGAVTILDATQSAGLRPLNINEFPADFIVFCSHKKLYGPENCSGFVRKREKSLSIFAAGDITFPKDQQLLELVSALRWRTARQPGLLAQEQFLAGLLKQEMAEKENRGIRLLCPEISPRDTGIVSFAVRGIQADILAKRLEQEFQIITRPAGQECPYCSSWLRGMDVSELLRISFGYMNTQEDIYKLLSALERISGKCYPLSPFFIRLTFLPSGDIIIKNERGINRIMDRKAIARETLEILKQGYYLVNGNRIAIEPMHEAAVKKSHYIPPEADMTPTEQRRPEKQKPSHIFIRPVTTVKAILEAQKAGRRGIGVLNFASAKNPGGGFINGAMAQEESLAASGGLYETQTAHWEYYEANRNTPSMIYTDGAIYSPDVVFFRDERFELLEEPVLASVLTLPAVNYGQVLLKGEDPELAKVRMKSRMRRSLQIFCKEGAENLILGAYGCGVFRNLPEDVAEWWKELLDKEFQDSFESICFAIFDKSKDQACLKAFEKYFA